MARVPIVDDEEMERVLMTSLLEPEGHELSYAEDVGTAYELCRSTDPDVVITDLAMPGASGLRLIKDLREQLIDVPIIAVSKWAADQLDLAQEYGADFILYKPLDADELRAAVREALDLRRTRPVGPWRRRD